MLEEDQNMVHAEPDHAHINCGNTDDIAELSELLGIREDCLIKNAKAFSGYASAMGFGNTLRREVVRRNGGSKPWR